MKPSKLRCEMEKERIGNAWASLGHIEGAGEERVKDEFVDRVQVTRSQKNTYRSAKPTCIPGFTAGYADVHTLHITRFGA
jgi:hypothetical protein